MKRSLQWKLWLEILPPNEDGWSISLSKERQCYDELKTKFLLNPSEIKGDLESNNPLTLEEDSPWQQYYKDLDLKQTIEQDVKRTFPDLQLFQSQSVQTLLSNVLFIYSKMNMDISYRQGMHELCAIVYYVVQEDKSQSFIFDSNYLEHDTATLFFKIMRSVKIWYESVDYTRRDGIPIVVLLNKIQGEYLKTLDPELFQHLTKQHIEPQLFGLRWLRLLFAREFQIQNLLFLWDGLFQHDPNLRLAEWIATAMLIHIRQELLESDYTETMHKLMRYPQIQTSCTEFVHSARGLMTKYEMLQGREPQSDLKSALDQLDAIDWTDLQQAKDRVSKAKLLISASMHGIKKQTSRPDLLQKSLSSLKALNFL